MIYVTDTTVIHCRWNSYQCFWRGPNTYCVITRASRTFGCVGSQLMHLMATCELLISKDSPFKNMAVGTAIKMTTTATPKTPRSTLAMETYLGWNRKVRNLSKKKTKKQKTAPREAYPNITSTCEYLPPTIFPLSVSDVVEPAPVQITTPSIQAQRAEKLCDAPALLLNIISKEVSKVGQ